MKKKILLAAVAAAMVVMMTACGSSSTTSTLTEVTSSTMEFSDVHANGLDGLVDYLEGNGIIGGTATEMKADIIGAEKGEKYTFQYNSATVVVELYQFDLDNLNDTDKETLESIKENGTFKVLDTDVEAKISKSGKYVMLYTDSSTDDTNTAQAQKAEELFQEYDEKEDQIVVKDTDSKKDTKDESASKTEDDTAEDSSAAE